MLAAIGFSVHLPNFPANRSPHEDAGVFLYIADLLRTGAGLPYREAWDHKPPLIYVLDAVGLAIGGGSEVGVWALQAIGFAIAAAVSHRVLAAAFGRGPAFFGVIAWLLAAPRLVLVDGVFTNFVQLYAPPLQWGALALLARASAASAFGAGLLGGAAALLSPALGGIWIAGAALLALRRAVRGVVLLGLGALLLAAGVIAPFAAGGALPDLLDQAFRYNTGYTTGAPLAERVEAMRWGLRLTLSSGLAPLALAGWLIAIVHFVRRRGSGLLALAVISLPIDVVFAGASGRSYDHYFIAWLPAMGVLAAQTASTASHAVRALAPRLRLHPDRAVAIALVVAIALMSLRPADVVTRALATQEDGASRIAARHLAAELTPSETAYIWGSRTESLFLAARRAPTRYVYPYGPLFTVGYSTDARIDELLGDLRSRRPAIILDASAASPVTPPLDRAAILAFDTHDRLFRVPPSLTRLVDLIETEYVRAGTLPHSGWPIWVRRDRAR